MCAGLNQIVGRFDKVIFLCGLDQIIGKYLQFEICVLDWIVGKYLQFEKYVQENYYDWIKL